MIRINRDPIWLLAAACAIGLVVDPAHSGLYLAGLGFMVSLRMLSWFIKRLRGSPIPDKAVRELLDRCTKEDHNEEWVLVKFRPGVSLEEARYKAGSEGYSEKERLMGFMTKLNVVSRAAPNVAIFYSADKGFLCGRRAVIAAMLDKYGRWILDTWFTLVGALRKKGYEVHSLDGPQFVATRSLFKGI